MQFWVDDEEMSCGFRFEGHEDGVDLTRDGLGERILDELVTGHAASARNECAPDGSRWAPLHPSTVKAKGSPRIGYKTGEMLGSLQGGRRQVYERTATWTIPPNVLVRARAFHQRRQLIGWTAGAKLNVVGLIRQAPSGRGA